MGTVSAGMRAHDRPASSPGAQPLSSADLAERVSEEVFVRNYDVERTYRLTISLTAVDGDDEYATTHRLRPGQAVSELGVVEPGRYRVRVDCDGARHATDEVFVGPAPAETLLIEVGNGAVSVSEGLY